jgi:polyhydroxybutyrate depolymerase
MTPATKLSLVLLSLCAAACAETGDEIDMSPSLPGTFEAGTSPEAGAPLPEAALPSGQDSGPSWLNSPEASTVAPAKEAGVLNPVDSGTPAVVVDAGPAVTVDAGPTSVSTKCSGPGTGMAGSTSMLMLNGRNYTLHIGRSVKPGEPSPLVFSLHGLTMTPASMESMARWDPIADTEGLIIARPAGVGASNGWDLTGTKDFDLMKAIIEDVNAKACVDRKRIYATGFSHGGFMSFSIACKLGDIFAAVAPASGAGSGARGCTARAVPVYAWHGDADGTVSYSSGKSAVDSWVTHDKCTGTPMSFMAGSAMCQDWSMCAEGSQVKFCTIPGGGHAYTRTSTPLIWEFFKAHPLP